MDDLGIPSFMETPIWDISSVQIEHLPRGFPKLRVLRPRAFDEDGEITCLAWISDPCVAPLLAKVIYKLHKKNRTKKTHSTRSILDGR
jgi:hypothetical protein